MAELLIYALTKPADLAVGYDRGDVVAAQPDGHAWHPSEGLPGFYVVVVPDTTPAQWAAYLEPEPLYDAIGVEIGVKYMRRLCAKDTPAAWQSEAAATGRLTKAWDEVCAFTFDRRTGEHVPEGRLLPAED